MSTVVQGILLAVIGVLLFGLIIFIHEFGHFFTAKLSHVCVNEFSIGMGPKLFSFTRGETQYSLRLLPIGGYCAMEGEDEKSDDPRAFGNRPVWQRMIVVAAGGIMNILLAVLLMMVICGQEDRYATMRIAGFAENSAFEAAGVEVGDVITSIDGYTVRTGQDLSFALSMAALDSTDGTAALDLTVKRGEEIVTFNDMTINTTSTDGKQYRAVLDFYVLGEERTPWTLIKNAFADTYSTVRMIFNSLIGIVTGRFGFSGLAGPVGTAQAVTQAASAGLKQSFGAAVNNIVYIMLVISVNLGIVNLLPLPALDGGKVFFLVINRYREVVVFVVNRYVFLFYSGELGHELVGISIVLDVYFERREGSVLNCEGPFHHVVEETIESISPSRHVPVFMKRNQIEHQRFPFLVFSKLRANVWNIHMSYRIFPNRHFHYTQMGLIKYYPCFTFKISPL